MGQGRGGGSKVWALSRKKGKGLRVPASVLGGITLAKCGKGVGRGGGAIQVEVGKLRKTRPLLA